MIGQIDEVGLIEPFPKERLFSFSFTSERHSAEYHFPPCDINIEGVEWIFSRKKLV